MSGWSGRLKEWARRAPFTLSVVGLMLALGLVTGSLWSAVSDRSWYPDVAYGLPSLEVGRWWTPVSGALFALIPAQYLAMAGGFLILAGFAEVRLGTRRAAVAIVTAQLVGVLGASLFLWLVAGHGWPWADSLALDLDVGFSAGAIGSAAAASAGLAAPWRGRLRFVLLMYCAINFLYVGALWDVEHLIAVVFGLMVGPRLVGRRWQLHRPRLGRHEVRLLAAAWTLFVALGSLLTSLLPGDGPLADPDAHITSGGGLEAYVSAALLLLFADGLRRGRRVAWRWVMVITVLSVLGALFPPYTPDSISNGILLGGLLVVLIVGQVNLKAFTVRWDRRRGWAVVGVVVAAFAALALYAWWGFSTVSGFDPPITGESATAEFISRLSLATSGEVTPTTFLSHAFLVSLSAAWWAVLLGSLLLVLWNNRTPPPSDHDEVATLIRRHGGSNLSWMTTWPENAHWFTPDRDACVAYRVHAGVAIGLGDPVCAEGDEAQVIAGFVAFAEAQGLLPCVFSTTGAVVAATAPLGWGALKVAEEAVVPLPGLEFKGKKWQDVRTALNRAGKDGVTFECGPLRDQSLLRVEMVRAISEQWVADKGLPEMGFTLGGVEEALDPEVRVALALNSEGRVDGLLSWLPVFGPGGQVRGWTLDVMRRREGGFRSVVEYLIASSALAFQAEGAEFVSLSGAPLAHTGEAGAPQGLERVLDVLGASMEPYYGFRSLHRFKTKFQPKYSPMYLCYPDDAALPRIGVALGRAYLPDAGLGDLITMARQG